MKNETRELGAKEKAFWILDQVAPVHFVMMGEISGELTVPALRGALNALQKRHPLLSVCIDSDGYKYPFFRRIESGSIPLRLVRGKSISDVEAEMEKELSIPFDWQEGPLARVVLIQNGNQSFLILVLQHTISDGMSGIYIYRDLLELLSGKILEQLSFPPSIDELLDRPVRALIEPEKNNSVLLQRKQQLVPSIRILKLSVDLTARLIEKAREENTTLHGALCVAFALASRKLPGDWKDKQLRVVSPVNIRKGVGAGEDVGFYFGAKTVLFDAIDTSSFWELARYVRNEIKGSDLSENILADLILVQLWLFGDSTAEDISSILQNKVVARELMISNLGRWPFETQFGSLKLETIAGPLALSGYPGEYTIGAVSTNGSLCLSLATRSPVEDVLIYAHEILNSLC
jgi:NRPS condensation-like uncharacterized protein